MASLAHGDWDGPLRDFLSTYLRDGWHYWNEAPGTAYDYSNVGISLAAYVVEAVTGGAAMGFLPVLLARRHPDLVEVLPQRQEWDSPLWLVTHVDLHRTTKVQSFVKFLKDEAKGWPS